MMILEDKITGEEQPMFASLKAHQFSINTRMLYGIFPTPDA